MRIARFQPSDLLDDEQANSSAEGKIQDEILFVFGRVGQDDEDDDDEVSKKETKTEFSQEYPVL